MRARGQNSARLAGRAVVEAHAEADQEVALLEQRGWCSGAPCMPIMPSDERVIVPAARRDRAASTRPESSRARRAARTSSAAPAAITPRADQQDRTLALRRAARPRARTPSSVAARAPHRRAGRGQPVDVDGLALHVLRHVDHAPAPADPRPRCETRRGAPASSSRGRAHQVVVLGDRDGEPVGVDLLERVGADHRARHLAGDRDQRDRVELRVGDRREQIRRARARRCRGRPPAVRSRAPCPAR